MSQSDIKRRFSFRACIGECIVRSVSRTMPDDVAPERDIARTDGAAIPADANAVNRVAVRIPTFWERNPGTRFRQLESQFALAGVTQDVTKNHYVCGNLDSRFADVVMGVINNPPATGMYETLKRELVRVASPCQRNDRFGRSLVDGEELGDRKPSVFLRHFQTLARDTMTDELLKTLWMDQLPASVRTVFITKKDDSLGELAVLTDAVIEVLPRAHVATASDSRDDDLRRSIAQLERGIAALLAERGKPTRRARFKSRRRTRSRSRHNGDRRDDGVCWYHGEFGAAARNAVARAVFRRETRREVVNRSRRHLARVKPPLRNGADYEDTIPR